jgi:hypothetical protein
MIYAVAASASIAVVAGLSGLLYGWFKLSLHRFDVVVAKDVLTKWDAHLAELPEDERNLQRTEPPVDVLEAIAALPSPWSQRFQLSYAN